MSPSETEVGRIKLLDNIGMAYGFSSRDFGNMAVTYGSLLKVLVNRKRFLCSLGINLGDVVLMNPVHGDNLELVRRTARGAIDRRAEDIPADGLITKERGVALALNAADCVPIIITTPDQEVLALVHSGRVGTDLEIAAKTVSMLGSMGVSPERLVVGIGPAIEKSCYELDWLETANPSGWSRWIASVDSRQELQRQPSIVDGQLKVDSYARQLYKFEAPGSKMQVDIVGYNRQQLIGSGVLAQNIEVASDCALHLAQQGRLFSHVQTRLHVGTPRAHEYPEGRFMAVAQLR